MQPDELRNRFDGMFDGLLARQGFLARKALAGKRQEAWVAFHGAVNQYYEDSCRWRTHCAKLAQEERLKDLGL